LLGLLGGIVFIVAMSFAALAGYQIRLGAVKAPSGKRKLETSGIYGIVRHPIYFGDTFWVVGLSIMFNSAYSLLLAPLWLGLFFLLAIVEEEKLREEYGKEYKDYPQKVPKRIIPWVL